MKLFLVLLSAFCLEKHFVISSEVKVEQKVVHSSPLLSYLEVRSTIDGEHHLYLKFSPHIMPRLRALDQQGLSFTFFEKENIIRITCNGPLVFTLPIYKVLSRVFSYLANIDRSVLLICPIAVKKTRSSTVEKHVIFTGNECADLPLIPDFSFPFKAFSLCGIILFFTLNFCVTEFCN